MVLLTAYLFIKQNLGIQSLGKWHEKEKEKKEKKSQSSFLKKSFYNLIKFCLVSLFYYVGFLVIIWGKNPLIKL